MFPLNIVLFMCFLSLRPNEAFNHHIKVVINELYVVAYNFIPSKLVVTPDLREHPSYKLVALIIFSWLLPTKILSNGEVFSSLLDKLWHLV